MFDFYKSPKIEDSFINFLSKSTASTKKRFFLVVNGLTEDQHDELNQHIEKTYKNQILVFVSANLLK
jgi:enolase